MMLYKVFRVDDLHIWLNKLFYVITHFETVMVLTRRTLERNIKVCLSLCVFFSLFLLITHTHIHTNKLSVSLSLIVFLSLSLSLGLTFISSICLSVLISISLCLCLFYSLSLSKYKNIYIYIYPSLFRSLYSLSFYLSI